MSKLVSIYKPIKATIPKPSRKVLESVVERMWLHAENHTHDLRAGDILDRFFAAAIDVAFRNLKAITLLSSRYNAECGALFRVLVETCVDFFWVASFINDRPQVAKRLAENFFAYSTWMFDQLVPQYRTKFNNDVFFRDVSNPYIDQYLIDKAVALAAGYSFGKTWRHEQSLLSELGDISWNDRAPIAGSFAEQQQNLKGSPYLSNLKTLSSFSHFDPAQVTQYSESFHEAMFDRNLNIALGFALDMLLYSYKRKGWQPPQSLCMLNHEFVYFST